MEKFKNYIIINPEKEDEELKLKTAYSFDGKIRTYDNLLDEDKNKAYKFSVHAIASLNNENILLYNFNTKELINYQQLEPNSFFCLAETNLDNYQEFLERAYFGASSFDIALPLLVKDNDNTVYFNQEGLNRSINHSFSFEEDELNWRQAKQIVENFKEQNETINHSL